MKSLARLIIISIIILGCTRKQTLQESRWSGEGARPSLPVENLKPSSESDLGSEKIQISDQVVQQFPVESSFVKTVSQGDQVVFQSFAVLEKIPDKVLAGAQELEKNKDQAWGLFLKSNAEYAKWKIEMPSKVIISTSDKVKAVLSTQVSNELGEIHEIQSDANGDLYKSTRLGSNLTDVTEVRALAFPKGPKRSDLVKVVMTKFNLPEGLSSGRIEVKSESPFRIPASSDLDIQPSDERFDQVQAYYFAQQIINWFEKNLVMKGPFKVEILANIGYPEKTNTAFYHRGQIRLGSGDDIAFSNIPWDPTIVMHEVSHALIDLVARLPFQGEGGSLNEGFADTFTTFYLDTPHLAENSYRKGPYKRTVSVPVRLAQKKGALYHDSAIVSSLFWKLKTDVSHDKALSLALKTLNRLAPNSDFKDFGLTIQEQAVEVFSGSDLEKVQLILKDWGF